ncbi:ribonuclease E/G [Pseudoroseomonas globiformis]|uniref:Ribonuclease E n=1 Tax=Teichococcus globiformis TaxID=2307229 RepID=A0ABV7FUA7_9PROT
MTKRMLIDASHSEETRVVVLDGNRIDEFDVETENKKPLKSNIYLAKVVRVEPSLQAAFVEYGGNRHGFLAFGEIHPDYYQIPTADREKLLALQAQEDAEDADDEDEISEAEADAMAEAIERFADGADGPEGDDLRARAGSGEPAPGTDASGNGQDDEPPPAQAMAIEGESRSASAAELAEEAARSAEVEPVEEEDDTPPETVGGRGRGRNGEDRDSEERDDRAERRIPPRFLRHYKIQEVIRRRQIMLVQVVKEERGNKGAALTTYISLAGRFSVLMPNSPKGGGISRKITSIADRKRLREVIQDLGMPRGMSMIVRTAGAGRPKPEIRRDCEYLLQLWDDIRERTLQSTAPALIYEEADLIKRSIRDVFNSGIEDIQIEGEDAYRQARDFMRMLMPQNERKIRLYRDGNVPLFARHGVDSQLDAMMSPTVQLKSGGYIVINQTEALVAIDVNSGRNTRDRHIEDTALRTNLEAADEVARQLRLRDMAGLIVIDFIDMESSRHDAQVERRLKEALRHDRARIQVGRISHFGLLEMSRQRLRPSVTEHSFETCPHCQGLGIVRSAPSAALQVLRQIEEEGAKRRAAEICVHIAPSLAIHLLNRRRDRISEIEARFGMAVFFEPDSSLSGPAIRIERLRAQTAPEPLSAPAALRMDYQPTAEPEESVAVPAAARAEEGAEIDEELPVVAAAEEAADRQEADGEGEGNGENRRRRRRRRRRGGRREDGTPQQDAAAEGEDAEEAAQEDEEPVVAADATPPPATAPREEDGLRRRGRRGGRRRPWEMEDAQREEHERPGRYVGPTPADPFAGTLDDIFDAMAAAEEAAEQPSSRPAAPDAVEPEVAPVLPVTAETPREVVIREGAPPAVPTPVVPVETPAEDAAPEAVEAAVVPAAAVAEVPAKPRRSRTPRAAKAKSEVAEAETAAAEKAAPKPRRSRAKAKPEEAVAEAGKDAAATSEVVPEAVPAAPKPRRSRVKAKPVEAQPELPSDLTMAPAAEAAAPEAVPAADTAPPAPVEAIPGPQESVPAVADPATGEPVSAPAVQPVLVEAVSEAPKRRGWWKR